MSIDAKIDLRTKETGRFGRIYNRLRPKGEARIVAGFLSGLCLKEPLTILVSGKQSVLFARVSGSNPLRIPSSESYALRLSKAGVLEFEIDRETSPKQILAIFQAITEGKPILSKPKYMLLVLDSKRRAIEPPTKITVDTNSVYERARSCPAERLGELAQELNDEKYALRKDWSRISPVPMGVGAGRAWTEESLRTLLERKRTDEAQRTAIIREQSTSPIRILYFNFQG